MSERYEPQTGDRVSLTGTVGAVIDGNVYIALDGGGSSVGAVSVYPEACTLVARPAAGTVLGAEATTKIEAWQLTTAHVLVVNGRRVPLAATDAGSDDYGRHVVLAQPADGGRPYRFDTHEEVTVGDVERVTEQQGPLCWWTISGKDLLDMLRRAAGGEDPDLVYVEAYANSDHEHFDATRPGALPEEDE